MKFIKFFLGLLALLLINSSLVIQAQAPVITSLSPTSGPATGGTEVTIMGSNLSEVFGFIYHAGDYYGGPFFSANIISDTEIHITTPAFSEGTYDTLLYNLDGYSDLTLADLFTFEGPPTITDISPSSGELQGGNTVTITGTGFISATSVTFNGRQASFSITNDSSISAVVPAHQYGATPIVNVVITNSYGSSTTGTGAYEYIVPTITAISPSNGMISGGTSVSITGTNLTNVTNVYFGTIPATSFIIESSTQITALSPSQSPGTVFITVQVPGAVSALDAANMYTYTSSLSLPTVTGLSVRSGPTSGGTSITLTGTGFTEATGVYFGSKIGTINRIISDTSMIVTSPAYVPATVHVTVNSTGTSPTTQADYFVFTGNWTLYSQGNAALMVIDPIYGSHSTIPYGFTDPNGFALTPIGDTAYLLGVSDTEGDGILPINLDTKTVGTFIGAAIGSIFQTYELYQICIPPQFPNPPIVYLSVDDISNSRGAVLPVNVQTETLGTITDTTPYPEYIPAGLQVSQDGTYAYILQGNLEDSSTTSNSIACVDIKTSTQVGIITLTGISVDDIELTPDGSTIYATQSLTGPVLSPISEPQLFSVNVSDPTNPVLIANSATLPLANAYEIAISPDGTKAFVTDYFTTVASLDITVSPPALLNTYGGLVAPLGVVVSPDGQYVYTQDTTQFAPGEYAVNQLNASDLSFSTFYSVTDSTFAIPPMADTLKISPDQAPLALFTVTPGYTNTTTTFNASESISPTGTIASYSWDFGDGSTDTGVSTSHTYTEASTYNVTLTVTNSAGTSTSVLTMGQTVSQNGGPSAVSVQAVTITEPPPIVTGISPTSGPIVGGTPVTITGSNFTGAIAVTFGSIPATSFSITNPTTISAVAPAGSAGTINVTVTTPGGSSSPGLGNQYTYVALPVVTLLNPNFGPTAGGTLVIITGANLSGATIVSFGSTNASSFSVVNSTTIGAVVPAGVVGIVYVTVTTPDGTSSIGAVNQYTYFAVPTVTELSQTSGPIAGGTSVVLTGTNFTGVTAVKFGSVASTSYSILNSTTIAAVAPPSSAGIVNVTVTGPGGTSSATSANKYTYVTNPTVTALSPNFGPTVGGGSVVITGTNFTGVTSVEFGSTNATSFSIVSSTTIAAVAPAGVVGTVNVTVTNPEGTSSISPASQYTYAEVPTVTGLSPNAGPLDAGTAVVITGTNFSGATSVQFGSEEAITFNVNSPNQIAAFAPAGTAGVVNVTVTTPEGTSVINVSNQYTYVNVPTVTLLSPNSGSTGGGTSVVVTGTNLTGASTVWFGSIAATVFTVVNPTTIVAIAPSETAGTVNVTVTTPGGTSDIGTDNEYTYE